ncbi:hypothetical protein [Leptolyngbya sp. FACHB-711]|nr:hypothetical protein [Leptolyngbya sp. FACHB-711]
MTRQPDLPLCTASVNLLPSGAIDRCHYGAMPKALASLTPS